MKVIKAKPGIFKGIQYRSRLEIMWAAFFDYFGIEFNYEPERFNLKSGSYLPDFYLKNVNFQEGKWGYHGPCVEGLWFEVKNPLHCTKIVDGYGQAKHRELDHTSTPFKLMEELTMQTSLQTWNIQHEYYDCTQITPGVIVWFTPADMYLDLSGYNCIELEDGITDTCEPTVQIANALEWEAHCMFWKCPACKTISFSRSYSLEEYGLAHTKTCKGNPARLALKDYVVRDSTDIHIMGNHIFYGNKHEEIGVAI
jgi:phage FluMu protein Com